MYKSTGPDRNWSYKKKKKKRKSKTFDRVTMVNFLNVLVQKKWQYKMRVVFLLHTADQIILNKKLTFPLDCPGIHFYIIILLIRPLIHLSSSQLHGLFLIILSNHVKYSLRSSPRN